LKSSSASLGARQLAELCKVVEEDARRNALEAAEAQLVTIEHEYERVITALKMELEETS
jgi:HPt (histidine-containing phosphotransfer) domain-containing protein